MLPEGTVTELINGVIYESPSPFRNDIIFVTKKNPSIIEDHIYGVPDLLIEVLSVGNSKYDSKTKKDLYEKFGIKEYWRIDPSTNLATGYSLTRGNIKKPLC